MTHSAPDGQRYRTRAGWTDRQKQVLDLLAKGHTNREIAEQLGITLDGAKWHVSEILGELGVDTREEAAEWWRQQNGFRARMRVLTRAFAAPGALRWAGIGGAVAVGAGAIVVAAIVIAGGNDAAAPEGEPTPPAAPTEPATPRPNGNGGENGAEFALAPQPDALEQFQGQPADLPAGAGVYFLDLDSGEVEGWNDPGSLGTTFAFSDDGRLVASQSLLIDRESGAVYGWDADAEVMLAASHWSTMGSPRISSSGGRVLFRSASEGAASHFDVVDLDAGPAIVASFDAEGTHALLAPDGSRAVVVGNSLQLVDLDSGEVTHLTGFSLTVDQPAEWHELRLSIQVAGTGDAFFVYGTDRSTGVSTWGHYRWSGDRIAGGTAPIDHISLSPDGRYMAASGPLLAPDGREGQLEAAYIIDIFDGSHVMRVAGGSTCFAYSEGSRWFADSASVVISLGRTPASNGIGPTPPYGRVTLDGEIQPFPESFREPRPSPLQAAAVAVALPPAGHFRVIDLDGNEIAGVTRDHTGDDQSRSLLQWTDPWGNDGSEVRFRTPVHAVGHSLCGPTSLITPTVDYPPYAAEPAVTLREAADGLALLSEPGGGDITGHLGGELRVQVHGTEVIGLEEGGGFGGYLWAQVTAIGSGAEGWMPIDALAPELGYIQWTPLLVDTGGSCVNVREAPDTDAESIECYPDGVPLTFRSVVVNDEPDGWTPVHTPDGRAGWVSSEFLQE